MLICHQQYSEKLQNEIELERKTVKKTFCDMKRQTDKAEKTIILHQDETCGIFIF
jgi:hypothetical protein